MLKLERLRCLLWYEEEEEVVVGDGVKKKKISRVEETELYEYRKIQQERSRPDISFLISCRASSNASRGGSGRVPTAVSVVSVPERRTSYCWTPGSFLAVRHLLPGEKSCWRVKEATLDSMDRLYIPLFLAINPCSDVPTQPPTVVCKMEHIARTFFCTFGADLYAQPVLINPKKKVLHRCSRGSLSRVRCWLGWSNF